MVFQTIRRDLTLLISIYLYTDRFQSTTTVNLYSPCKVRISAVALPAWSSRAVLTWKVDVIAVLTRNFYGHVCEGGGWQWLAGCRRFNEGQMNLI